MKRTISLAMGLLTLTGAALMSPDASAQCVYGPIRVDPFVTPFAPPENCHDFSETCPIPADFFGPGSDPFSEVICFQGAPLGPTNLPGFGTLDFGDADTLVRRDIDPFDICDLPGGGSVDIPIELIALNLVSSAPIIVTFNGGQDPEFWDVRITADHFPQPGGTLTATKEHCNGGTYDSTMSVCTVFVFTRQIDNFEVSWDHCDNCDPAGIPMVATDVPWIRFPVGGSSNPVCSGFHAGLADPAPTLDCGCRQGHSSDYESPTYTGTAAGTAINGQEGFYIPILDSFDGQVYSYGTAGPALSGPRGIAVEASGDLVVADLLSAAVSRVDPITGDRTIVSDAGTGAGPAFFSPSDVAVEATGDLVVADSGADAVIRVDPVTGDRTIVSDAGTGAGPALDTPFGIAVEASGDLVVADIFLAVVFRVDPVTGDRTIVSGGGTGTGPTLTLPFGIAVEASGDLVVTDVFASAVIRVDPVTGDRSIVSFVGTGDGPLLVEPAGIAVEASGDLVVTDRTEQAVFRVDPVTGDRTIVSDAGTGGGPAIVDVQGIAVEASGELVATDFDLVAVLRVNPINGNRTILSGTGNSLGLPQNPTGGDQFVGVTGGDTGLVVPFARAQRDMAFCPDTGQWSACYDIAATYTGTLPSDQNIGSFSTQLFPGAQSLIALARWVDPVTAAAWNADYVWFNSVGTQLIESVPNPGFQNLQTEHWYRWCTVFDLDTHLVVEVSITDLTTGGTVTHSPASRYLDGGVSGNPTPTGFRFFAGSGTVGAEGNTLAFDNLDIENVCTWDLNCDGSVGIVDLLELLGNWGNPYGIVELLALLAAWGPC